MNKSKGMKAASIFFGVLLYMALVKFAYAQPIVVSSWEPENISNATLNTATGNAVELSEPSLYSVSAALQAGSHYQGSVSFTNRGNETVVITPKMVSTNNGKNNISKDWITISPTNATVLPGSDQEFLVDVDFPTDIEGGKYKITIDFNDTFVPNSVRLIANLSFSVKALSKIHPETRYILDSISAGKEYEYKLSIKNEATKDLAINPKILKHNDFYDPNYKPAFNSDAINISAPSIIKAGETENMTITVKVPENATGQYYGTIGMNVSGETATNYVETQIVLKFNVWKQPHAPYVKTFRTVNDKPITIEVSAVTSDNPWLQSPKKEDPSFELNLTHNGTPVNMTLVKSLESSSVGIDSYSPTIASLFGGLISSSLPNLVGSTTILRSMDKNNTYQAQEHHIETYKIPGAIGDWELQILPKNTQAFGYSITVGDSNSEIK